MRERNREDVTFEERFNELVDINDGNMHLAASVKGEGVRYVHTPGLYFSMKPEIEDVTIYDTVCLFDYLSKFKVYYKLHQVALGIFVLLGFSIFFSPIVWMDVTGTDIIFFGNRNVVASSILWSRRVFNQHVSYMVCGVSSFGH